MLWERWDDRRGSRHQSISRITVSQTIQPERILDRKYYNRELEIQIKGLFFPFSDHSIILESLIQLSLLYYTGSIRFKPSSSWEYFKMSIIWKFLLNAFYIYNRLSENFKCPFNWENTLEVLTRNILNKKKNLKPTKEEISLRIHDKNWKFTFYWYS